jgi:hypothetical protein
MAAPVRSVQLTGRFQSTSTEMKCAQIFVKFFTGTSRTYGVLRIWHAVVRMGPIVGLSLPTLAVFRGTKFKQ